jgi:DNA-directed RNA polymerase subunit N (RpoN/RPB10)
LKRVPKAERPLRKATEMEALYALQKGAKHLDQVLADPDIESYCGRRRLIKEHVLAKSLCRYIFAMGGHTALSLLAEEATELNSRVTTAKEKRASKEGNSRYRTLLKSRGTA